MSRRALALLGAIALASVDIFALGGRVDPRPASMEPERRVLEEIRDRARRQREAASPPTREEREAAAARVVALDEFKRAGTIHMYMAAPMYPVRLAALRAGKKVVATGGRLMGLYVVDPAGIAEADLEEAATARGLRTFGTEVDVDEPIKIDLYIIKSVAVDPASGRRIGPIGNGEELEYAMFRQMRALDEATPVVTMVDAFSVVEGIDFGQGSEPLCAKVPADIICTPEATIQASASLEKLGGVDFDRLGEARFRESRLLRRLRAKTWAGEMP